MATECAFCHKEIRSQQTEDDAVEVLESIDTTEPTVVCPQCGGSNFLGTEFCYLCNSRLHPLLSARAPQEHPVAPPLSPATAAKLMLGLAAAVVALLIGVMAIVNAGVKAFSDQPVVAQDRQEYVVASRLAPSTGVGAGGQAQVIEEELPAEPSALQRYKADRKKHPEKYRSAVTDSATTKKPVVTSGKTVLVPNSPYSGDYVLPLPVGGRFYTSGQKTGEEYVTGATSYAVDRKLGDVWQVYELEKLLGACFSQDMLPTSSSRQYRGGRDSDDMVRFEVNIAFDDYKDCSARIVMTPSAAHPKSKTDILLTYTIPKGRTIRLSTSANGK